MGQGRPPKLTTDQQDAAVAEYLAGDSYAVVAERWGLTPGAIYHYAKDRGVQGRGGRFARFEGPRQQVLDLWRQGERASEIARKLDLRPQVVRTWVKSVNGGPTLRAEQQAVESVIRYGAGETIEQIAESLGRSVNTVSAWLREAGVEIKSALDRRTAEDRSRYASVAGRGNKQIDTRVCDHCGKDFSILDGKKRPSQQMFCSKECSNLGRRDPSKRRVSTCRQCGIEFEGWSRQIRAYCSRECWAKHSPDQHHLYLLEDDEIVKFDSSWEAYVWGHCKIHKIPIERVDRAEAIEWAPGRWYAPDFRLGDGRYIEVKGVEDDLDGERWDLWPHPLIVLTREMILAGSVLPI